MLNATIIMGKGTQEEAISKRKGEFVAWFDGFTVVVRSMQAKNKLPVSHTNTGNFRFPDNAAEAVNVLYWKLMDELVRPMVMATNGNPETNIDRHKICSLTELAVITIQPIESEDASFAQELNARLAYHCAISFIANFLKLAPDSVANYIDRKVAENHLTWLRNYDPNEVTPPIFANAVTWQLIEQNHMLRKRLAELLPSQR